MVYNPACVAVGPAILALKRPKQAVPEPSTQHKEGSQALNTVLCMCSDVIRQFHCMLNDFELYESEACVSKEVDVVELDLYHTVQPRMQVCWRMPLEHSDNDCSLYIPLFDV